MSLRLYDTATREVRDFEPIEPGRVGVYLCGATVQSAPHIGHLRSGLAFDILRRWLTHRGFRVVFIRNVTDIDDKILARSAEAGCPWWVIAAENERAFTAGYDALNVLPPTYEPRATGHVTEMVELIGVLIERGHAYPAADDSGDVYFDVRSFDGYGALTNQRLDDMAPAQDADPRGKRDPRDFALWKGYKPGEPASASWPTPWGRGRPGWHLECSAMAAKYLGTAFDIHGGGVDLRFPHHENERAQSHAAGQEFARFWMHNGWVTTGGEKMSKSLGNSLLVTTMLEQTRPAVLRYYLGAAHYRSTIEYGPDSLREAQAAYERIEGFVTRASERLGARERLGDGVAAVQADGQASPVPAAFAAAMDDDLAVPAALAVVHGCVRDGNRALDAGDEEALARALGAVLAMTGVLGIDPTDQHWVGAPSRVDGSSRGGSGQATHQALEVLVRAELEARTRARVDKDFDAADAIRRRLSVAGIAVEDTPTGARWTLEGGT